MQRRLAHPGPSIPAEQVLGSFQAPSNYWVGTTNTSGTMLPGVQWSGNTSQASYVSAASLVNQK